MTKKIKTLSLALFIALFSNLTYAVEEEKKEQSLQEEITEYINHHVQDSHDFALFSTKDKVTGEKIYIDFPLPVILIDEGVKVFMSSKLEHGKKVVNKGGKHYKLYHGKIYETNAEGLIEYDANGKVINAKPLDLSITKSVFTIMMVSLLMILLFVSLAKSYNENNKIAKGIGRFFEPIVIYIRDEIAIPSIGTVSYTHLRAHET